MGWNGVDMSGTDESVILTCGLYRNAGMINGS